MQQPSHPTIALLTDFGLTDTYVGTMKGVIAAVAPGANTIDLNHHIPPQDVAAGAYALLTSYADFPSGTVFCCVVDPEVGSGRDALAAQVTAQGETYLFVFPDNGLLTPILQEVTTEAVVSLDNPAYHHKKASRTFHGRDIFAPVSAHLANGVDIEALGTCRDPDRLRRLEWPEVILTDDGFEVRIIHIDHFGNLITNLKGERLEPEASAWTVVCGDVVLDGVSATFADVPPGQPLAYVGSAGFLELAIRQGNAAVDWGAARSDRVRVQRSDRG
ncbi:SAM-dependent chlorinase/fluorinase [soil metagenome]